MKKTSTLLVLICSFSSLVAQIKQRTVVFVEPSASVSIGRTTPFWLVSNRQANLSLSKGNLLGSAGMAADFDTVRHISFGFALQTSIRQSNKTDFWLPEAYAKLKVYMFELSAGNRNYHFGNQDPLLSSGNLLWSGNVRAIPQISIAVPEYTSLIPGFVEVKGFLSHGWVNDNDSVKNYYIHHKNGYIRLGWKNFPVKISYGLEHVAQWGGTSSKYGKLPSSLKDYYKVFFARGGGDDAPYDEQINRLGNHIGSKNYAIEYFGEKINISLYWQYMFEDASKDRWENISDGLWGMSLELKNNPVLKRVCYEFVKTNNQSGPIHNWVDNDSVHIHIGGNDNYFNNYVYQAGWTYEGYTIGTPFITSSVYNNASQGLRLQNNRIIAHHLGFSGSITKKVAFLAYASYVRNYGTFSLNSFNGKKENLSFLLQLDITCNRYIDLIRCALGSDFGKMYGNNAGIFLSMRKNLHL